MRISQLIEARGLTQAAAARVFGVGPPQACALLRGRTSGFSIGRLFQFLGAPGNHVAMGVEKGSRQGPRHIQAVLRWRIARERHSRP